MDMHTSLRCKVIIKDEFRKEFEMLNANNFDWSLSTIEFIKKFSDFPRNKFIPNGVFSSRPNHWMQAPYDKFGVGVPTNGFERNFDVETGLWSFQCSLKDNDSTIDEFIAKILTKVAEEIIHLELFHPDIDNNIHYSFKDDGTIDSFLKTF
jgi:hypothetical protein